jgi:hypothetical protein
MPTLVNTAKLTSFTDLVGYLTDLVGYRGLEV